MSTKFQVQPKVKQTTCLGKRKGMPNSSYSLEDRSEVAEEGEYPALRGKNDGEGQKIDFSNRFFLNQKKRPQHPFTRIPQRLPLLPTAPCSPHTRTVQYSATVALQLALLVVHISGGVARKVQHRHRWRIIKGHLRCIHLLYK